MTNRLYEPNPKHKRGACGDGPPRWFPSSDSLCPDDIDLDLAQELLDGAVADNDQAHAGGRALYCLYEGQFFKAYRTESRGDVEVWHGYPVSKDQVGEQIPATVLRIFRQRGQLTNAAYKKLVGSA